MTTAAWSSEAIRVSDAACFDVKASSESVVLGLFVGKGEVATDYHFTPDQARTLARALVEGSIQCDLLGGGA